MSDSILRKGSVLLPPLVSTLDDNVPVHVDSTVRVADLVRALSSVGLSITSTGNGLLIHPAATPLPAQRA